MANNKDTLNLIKFRFGEFQQIKDLGSKNQVDFFFCTDKPTFYNAGVWYGVSSLTSNLNEETGEVTIKLNSNLGENNWPSSQMECKFMGITPTQANKINVAYDFVTGKVEDADNIINQWKEVVDFLKGIEEQEGGLAVKFQNLDSRIDDEVTAREEADIKHTEAIQAINDMLAEMFTLERDGETLKSIKANVGLWTDSFLSARGKDENATGGGGAGFDVNRFWQELTGKTDGSTVIDISHIPDISVAKITDFTSQVNSLVANKVNKGSVVDLTSAQYISGAKTFSNLQVSNTNLVSNLNAEMLGGKRLSEIIQTTWFNEPIDLNTFRSHTTWLSGYWASDKSSSVTNQPSWDVKSAANVWTLPGNYPLQIAKYFNSTDIRVRALLGNNGASNWKQLAFIDSNVASADALSPQLIVNSVVEDATPNRFFVTKTGASELPVDESYLAGFSLVQDENANFKSMFALSANNHAYIKLGSQGWKKLASENTAVKFTSIEASYCSINGTLDASKLNVYGDTTINSALSVDGVINANNGIRFNKGTKGVNIWYDEVNDCLRTDKGFASDSFISAGGVNSTGGGAGFDVSRMWQELKVESNNIIDISHIPSLTSAKITDFNSAAINALTPALSGVADDINDLEARISALEEALRWRSYDA